MEKTNKAPPSATAALLWFPSSRSFGVAFVGINKAVEVNPTLVAEFPFPKTTVTQQEIEVSVKTQQPMKLSTCCGRAEFMKIKVNSLGFNFHRDLHPWASKECGHDRIRYIHNSRFLRVLHRGRDRQTSNLQ
jgi:hypothetical protein